jgi:hypothetical protein
MTTVKEVGRRRTQLLDNRGRYWELKRKLKIEKRWKQQFITGT